MLDKKSKRPRNQEEKEQSYFFNWLCLFYPKLRYNCFAIPNGGSRAKKEFTLKNGKKILFSLEGKRLKEQGVTAGVPDVMCCIARGKYHGLFIEFKVGKNKLSPDQKSMIGRLEEEGYKCAVCYGWEEGKDAFKDYVNLEEF